MSTSSNGGQLGALAAVVSEDGLATARHDDRIRDVI